MTGHEAVFWLVAGVFAFLSFWGWLFHFDVGPAHGAGAELGILGGIGTLIFAGVALFLRGSRRR